MTVVLDASAMVELLLDRPGAGDIERLIRAGATAPAHFDAEVLGGLARVERLALAGADRVAVAVTRLVRAPVIRVPLSPLVTSAWRWRANVSPADALYVALARQLAVTLVTTDRRLARAPLGGVAVTVVGT
jgi:predicted nucleic acid-binding protein